MQFFLQIPTDDPFTEPKVSLTPEYIEVGVDYRQFQGNRVGFYYVIPLAAGTVVIATCWDDYFDRFLSSEQLARLGPTWPDVLVRTYPTLGRVLTNAVEGRYSGGALLQMIDPDYHEAKWFVATVVGNLFFGELDGEAFLEALFAEPRVQHAVMTVMDTSEKIAVELDSRKVSGFDWAKLTARGAARGYVQGLQWGAELLSKLQWFRFE